MSELPDRRPIPARDAAASRSLAQALVSWGVSANAISLAGLVAGLAAGAAFAATARYPSAARWAWLVGAALVGARLLANMLDGMVALASSRGASRTGELYNEIPDRLSDSAALVGLGYAAGGNVTLGWAAALAAVFTAYVRAAGKCAGGRYDFAGPMAKQQRMFLVIALAVFLAASPAAWHAVAGVALPTAVLGVILVGSAVTAARRLVRISRELRAGARP